MICTDIDHATLAEDCDELAAEVRELAAHVAGLERRLRAASGALEFIEVAAKNSKRLDATTVALYAADVRRALDA